MQVRDKVFVVTGAGNGMGRQVVLELAARGARVAAADLDPVGLADTVRLAGAVGAITTHTLDVTEPAAVAALPDAVVLEHGQVDGVVNIAGIIHRFVEFSDLSDAEVRRIMDVNFWRTVSMCRAFIPVLRSRPSASLVNMASLAALVPFAGQTVYGASKGAVKQFSEGLAAELMGTSVSVSTIFPGNISTNLTGNSGVTMPEVGAKRAHATSPDEAGRIIVRGIERDAFRILVGRDARLLDRLSRVSARRATELIAARMKTVL